MAEALTRGRSLPTVSGQVERLFFTSSPGCTTGLLFDDQRAAAPDRFAEVLTPMFDGDTLRGPPPPFGSSGFGMELGV